MLWVYTDAQFILGKVYSMYTSMCECVYQVSVLLIHLFLEYLIFIGQWEMENGETEQHCDCSLCEDSICNLYLQSLAVTAIGAGAATCTLGCGGLTKQNLNQKKSLYHLVLMFCLLQSVNINKCVFKCEHINTLSV